MTDVEQVLVVPREAAISAGNWRGVRREPLAQFLAVVADQGLHRPRPEMERDPSQKQVIPYLVLRDGRRWFLMRRSRAGADARLHERFSIGVGGHMNPGDTSVAAGLEREWREEVDAAFVPAFDYVGLLNDDETEVGSVHLGVVFQADAAGRPVRVRETDKLSGEFVEAEGVEAVRDRLETWSALVFDALRDHST